jgi:hypothetical protein
MARGPGVSRVRAITQLCKLRTTVESYTAPRGPLQCRRCQRFGHTQRGCGYAPRCVACGEDLAVPFFADHIRALTDSFDSKLADAGIPLVRQIGRYLTEGWRKSPEAQAKGVDGQQTGRDRP